MWSVNFLAIFIMLPLTYIFHVVYSKQFFEEAGEVVDVRLSTFEDGSFKGYGHVEFATAEAAQKVNNALTILLWDAASFNCYQNITPQSRQVLFANALFFSF